NGLHLQWIGPSLDCFKTISLHDYVSAEHAQIRIFRDPTGELLCTQDEVKIKGAKSPLVTSIFQRPPPRMGTFAQDGYRVDVRELNVKPSGQVKLLYARPFADVDHTLAKVRFFLILGVFGGTILALLAGLATAQRAMRPVVQLTEASREIERTRDPKLHIP